MSWGELLLIGGVALIVIKPKDLPKAMRTVGQMTGKVRRMAGEFQSQFTEAMREAELQDVRKEVESINRDVMAATSTAFNPIQTIRNEIKTSIDGVSAPAAPEIPTDPASEWTPGQSELTLSPVEDAGPVHHIEPATPADHATVPAATTDLTNPDVAPLLPSPVHEPVLAHDPAPSIVTGPGLEQAVETETTKPSDSPKSADLPKEARS